MSAARRLLREAEEAFRSEGMDVRQWAALLTKMGRGYRDVVDKDRWQLARDGTPKFFKPKIATIIDENGKEKEVVAIDATTQLRALRLIGEVLGIVTPGGVSVNVANGHGAIASDGEVNVLALAIDSDGRDLMREAIAALPAPDRRLMLEKLFYPTAKEVERARLPDAP